MKKFLETGKLFNRKTSSGFYEKLSLSVQALIFSVGTSTAAANTSPEQIASVDTIQQEPVTYTIEPLQTEEPDSSMIVKFLKGDELNAFILRFAKSEFIENTQKGVEHDGDEYYSDEALEYVWNILEKSLSDNSNAHFSNEEEIKYYEGIIATYLPETLNLMSKSKGIED